MIIPSLVLTVLRKSSRPILVGGCGWIRAGAGLFAYRWAGLTKVAHACMVAKQISPT